jgi:hypothetical protein
MLRLGKPMIRRVDPIQRPLWVALLMLVAPLCAATDEELPSLEFLEYLGEWQDESGELIDPLLLSESDVVGDAARSEGESQ